MMSTYFQIPLNSRYIILLFKTSPRYRKCETLACHNPMSCHELLQGQCYLFTIEKYTGCLQRNAVILSYRVSTMKRREFVDVLKLGKCFFWC
jgi:hypothetical protein